MARSIDTLPVVLTLYSHGRGLDQVHPANGGVEFEDGRPTSQGADLARRAGVHPTLARPAARLILHGARDLGLLARQSLATATQPLINEGSSGRMSIHRDRDAEGPIAPTMNNEKMAQFLGDGLLVTRVGRGAQLTLLGGSC